MKTFWINLPVKDIEKSREFFKRIGFKENPRFKNADHLASFIIGEQEVVMMLFPEDTFQRFTENGISNTQQGTEVLLNIDAESRSEVDEMAKKVKNAGGTIFAKPAESEGWMYVFGFEDLDGHRWVMLHMELDKMPK